MRTPHYLSPLKTTRIPDLHSVIDCETRASKKHGRIAHRWAVGAVCHGGIDDEGYWGQQAGQDFIKPADLWAEVASWHPLGAHLIVWAHNLSFDLRVSEALRWLPVEGYALEAIVLEKTAAWASFDSPRGKLTVCDLHSWLPVSLNRVAAAMGRGRRKVHYASMSAKELAHHCINDVEVTAEAVGHLIEYLHREECGSFRPTGSGMSHSAWRRKWLPAKTVLIHGDESALERERVAMWTGRAEAWRWGKVDGPLFEHDLHLAYCRVAAHNAVPVKLFQRTGRTSVEAYLEQVKVNAVLADVTVETNQEVVPTSEDGRVFWPTGKFNTTLWDPELERLIRSGANVTIHRTWRYGTAPVLAPMACHLIEALEDTDEGTHPVVKIMLKHWARTLVGRCALRYREWDDFGSIGVMGLSLSTMFDDDTGEVSQLLQVGHRIMELAGMAEADSSVPQITGWVMSRARVNLWNLMQVAGLENLAYVDTDCLIVNGAGHHRLGTYALPSPEIELVHKSTHDKAVIYGPRNLILEGERRLSGVPKKAIMTGELHFDGEVWGGLRASLENKRPSEVAITPRTFDVEDSDPRRQRTEGGTTIPYVQE